MNTIKILLLIALFSLIFGNIAAIIFNGAPFIRESYLQGSVLLIALPLFLIDLYENNDIF